jgi:hypothetical protein
MAPSEPSRTLPPETLLAAFCVLAALLFSLAEFGLLHPGAAWPDELSNLQLIQEWREGAALPLSFFKGCLHRYAMAFCAGHGRASLLRLHWPALAAFLAESAALHVLGRRYFSERAGAWAVALNAAAAFTLFKLRSLLSYGFLPAELLLLLVALPHLGRAWAALLAGLAAGLLLLDYEGWALALPLLFLAAAALPRGRRPSWAAALGLALGAGWVAWLSRAELGDYWLLRTVHSLQGGGAGLGANLKSFWLGGNAAPPFGAAAWPAFPALAWPALLGGIAIAWKRARWMVAALLLGLAPLALKNSGAEPQRLIAAWPLLCLAAGAGFAWMQGLGKRGAMAVAWVFAALALLECRAYLRSMDAAYPSSYGFSAQLLRAGRAHPGPWRLLSELDNQGAGAARFLLESAGLKDDPAAPALAVVPLGYERGLDKQGRLEAFGAFSLYYPGPASAERLARADAELGPLWRSLPRYQGRRARSEVLGYLLAHPQADPWVKSACYEFILGQSFMLGEFPADLVKRMEGDHLQSVNGLEWSAARRGGAQ